MEFFTYICKSDKRTLNSMKDKFKEWTNLLFSVILFFLFVPPVKSSTTWGLGYNLGFLRSTNTFQALAGYHNLKYANLEDPMNVGSFYRGFCYRYTWEENSLGIEMMLTSKYLEDEAEGTFKNGEKHKSFLAGRIRTFNMGMFFGEQVLKFGASVDVGTIWLASKSAEISVYDDTEPGEWSNFFVTFTFFAEIRGGDFLSIRPYYHWDVFDVTSPGDYLIRADNFGIMFMVFLKTN